MKAWVLAFALLLGCAFQEVRKPDGTVIRQAAFGSSSAVYQAKADEITETRGGKGSRPFYDFWAGLAAGILTALAAS